MPEPSTHSIDARATGGVHFPMMRFLLAGCLILIISTIARAQATGQVLDIGFNNAYRPDCWTPMLVQLTSKSNDAQTFQIQIVQEDLDRDRVTYSQPVTLGGNVEGHGPTTENFWVYFKPKPTDGGLPDQTDTTVNLTTLSTQLKVLLRDKDDKFTTLPLTSTILNVDPVRSVGDGARNRKLILFVHDPGSTDKPEIPDFAYQKGVLQDFEAVSIKPDNLPSNVIGYEGVDTIVWMDADANYLISGTRTPSLEAIQQWVHQGGHLVVCQPPEPFKIKPFADMLPVSDQQDGQWKISMVDRKGADVLRRLARPDNSNAPDWPDDLGTFKVARAPALPDAKVEEWIEWNDVGSGKGKSYTPWLARRGIGLGCVTWVAQDLGNASLTNGIRYGWRYVWDRVFDWNDPVVPEDYKVQDISDDKWNPGQPADLGYVTIVGMDLQSTAMFLVSLAVIFFIGYWLVAGPGLLWFLARQDKKRLSWFYFGGIAVVATLLTALLVKIVVRGPPKLQHVSLVQYAAGEPNAVIDSRFGLYIPQDRQEKIGLNETAAQEVSYVTPFSIHPQYASSSDALPAYLEYQIPVRDASETDPVSISIPYRSTSKKLEAHWIGQLKETIEIQPDAPVKLVGNRITGTLVNHTGADLFHVFLMFKQPYLAAGPMSTHDNDILVYIEFWAKDDSLKLDDLLTTKNSMNLLADNKHAPMGKDATWGPIAGRDGFDWMTYWRNNPDMMHDNWDASLPMLTAFDRLQTWRGGNDKRREFFHRGGRQFDLSRALSAGELVVCAMGSVKGDTAQSPLPIPLTVSDRSVTGPGTTIFQFVLPMDRSAVYSDPSTRPAGE